jgi:hypothetical protein
VLNPLRSEAEAFRFLLYSFVVIAVIVALVLILRAIFWHRRRRASRGVGARLYLTVSVPYMPA